MEEIAGKQVRFGTVDFRYLYDIMVIFTKEGSPK